MFILVSLCRRYFFSLSGKLKKEAIVIMLVWVREKDTIRMIIIKNTNIVFVLYTKRK